jgi:quercetin dioxygenase-like cupin family protein
MRDDGTSNLRTIDEVRFQKLWQGISGRIVEGERLTVAVVELEPNGTVPSHQHEHEQMGLVIRGQVTFTVGDETRTFGPGGTWRVPSMTPHGALTGPDGATVVDVFNPIRDDWHAAPIDEEVEARWP